MLSACESDLSEAARVAEPAWSRRLLADLSQRIRGFDLRSVYVGFVVDQVALG